ncbi:group I intron-associated PD-(D/E)XK endonuclease [Robertmurraya andreesenii]|uniref:group I intron-associated PD-(D/E)XK endonuclease n=1 Tax=Anoxybacillus andreesenii TaxID=1325932 RepID=UPI0035214178
MAHETVTKGRHSELLAQTALLANGWSVAEPIAPEPFDLVARAPGTSEWQRIQIKSARVRDDRNGEIVCYARKNSGKPYDKDDCDKFIAVLNGEVFMFDNRGISEYWVGADSIDAKWTRLSTGIESLKLCEGAGA